MVNLSWLLEKSFELHGVLPRWLWHDGRAFQPIHMLMEVTYRCNLRCNFCQYLDIIEGRKEPVGPVRNDLPKESLLRWIDEFPRGRLITFAGGETMVRKDFPEIMAHAARHHRTHLITNGALVSEAVARSYIDLAPRWIWQNGLVLLEMSLQGDELLHDRITQRRGSWRQAAEGMRHLARFRKEARKTFPKLGLKLVVTRHTVAVMPAFMELAKELGVDIVNFLAEHDLTGNSEAGNQEYLTRPQKPPLGVDPLFLRQQLIRCYELERSLGMQLRLTPRVPIDEFAGHYAADRELDDTQYACEGVWSRIGIGASGHTGTVCPYFATGDMRTTSLSDSWNGAELRAFRARLRDNRVYPGCHGCCNLKYIGDKKFGLAGASQSESLPLPCESDAAAA